MKKYISPTLVYTIYSLSLGLIILILKFTIIDSLARLYKDFGATDLFPATKFLASIRPIGFISGIIIFSTGLSIILSLLNQYLADRKKSHILALITIIFTILLSILLFISIIIPVVQSSTFGE